MKKLLWYLPIYIICVTASAQAPYAFAVYGYRDQGKDVFGWLNNPSALASLKKQGAGIYSEKKYMLEELNYYALAAAVNAASGGFGFTMNYAGSTVYNETNIGVAYGRELATGIDAGMKIIWNRISIPGYGMASSFSVTAGATCILSEKFRTGVFVDQPLRSKYGIEKTETSPAIYSLGFGYEASGKFYAGAEIKKRQGEPVAMLTGIRYSILEQVRLDAGIEISNVNSYLGIHYLFRSMMLGLYTSYHMQLGFTPGIMISFQFNRKKT